MKELDEQIIWKFLDGNCTEEEKIQAESLLQNQSASLEEFELRRALDFQLDNLELEAPSLDFTAKVMGIIPNSTAITVVKPLISPIWTKAAIASFLVIFSASIILLFSYSSSQVDSPFLDKIGDFNDTFNAMFHTVPFSIYEFSGLAILSVGFLVFLDLFLKKKFHKQDFSL